MLKRANNACYGFEKVEETFWIGDLFVFKDSALTAVKRDADGKGVGPQGGASRYKTLLSTPIYWKVILIKKFQDRKN